MLMSSEDDRPAGTPSMQSSDGGHGVTIRLDNMTDSVEAPHSLAKEHQKAGEKYSSPSLHCRRYFSWLFQGNFHANSGPS